MKLVAAAAALVLAGALPRLLLASELLPDVLRPFIWSDVLFTWERGVSGGRAPYWDAYFEYPPLVGYLTGLFGTVAATPVAYLALWTAAQVFAAAMTGWALRGTGSRGWWAWGLAPQLALFGPINFDLLAITALVIAVRSETEGARLRSTVAIALGTATKLFPAAALPLFLVRARESIRGTALHLAVFAGILVAAYAPGSAAPFSTLESLGRYSIGMRANFDSVWGLLDSLLRGIGLASTAIVGALSLGGLVATYALVALRRAGSGDQPGRLAASAVLSLLLFTRLYSPQYSLWVLPFFALAGLPRRAFALLTVADIVVFLTVYPLTLVDGIAGSTRDVLIGALAGAVVLRHVGLAIAFRAIVRPC